MAEESLDIIEVTEFVHPPRPFVWQDYLDEAGYILAAATVLVLLIWLIRFRIRKGPTPLKRALKAYSRARAERAARGPLWFTLRSNRILRDFFHFLFDIEAPALTSREFLDEVVRLNVLSGERKKWLEEYLQSCDKIRFAAGEVTEEELDEFYQKAVDLVKSVYRRQRAHPSEPETAAEKSPYLPGTPVPDPEEAVREREQEEAERKAAEEAELAGGIPS